MNPLQLVLKNMRQRSLSTWLTLLSVLLGVALATAIMVLRREGKNLFGQSEYGYDLIVGTKGSPLQLTLNTVYQLDRSPGNIPWAVYDELRGRKFRADVRFAFPVVAGDSYQGRRIVGARPQMFGFGDDGSPLDGYDAQGRLLATHESPSSDPHSRDQDKPVAGQALEIRPGQKYTLAQGRMFHAAKFEAVIGADVQKLTGLKLGDTFQATHGTPEGNQRADVHDERWTVVGVLSDTKTAADGVIYIPLTSFYTIQDHGDAELDREWLRRGWNPATRPADAHDAEDAIAAAEGREVDHAGHDHDPGDDEHGGHAHVKHYSMNPDGTIELKLPQASLELSAVIVKTRGPFQTQSLLYTLGLRNDVMGVNPAETMRQFFDTFLSGTSVLLLMIAVLVTIVAAVGILVSIYNSVAARSQEIAILRALGATRVKVLTLITLEAALIGLVGGLLGLVAGHLIAGAASMFLQRLLGSGVKWLRFDGYEAMYLLGVVAIAALAGLVPALKAYRTPVATNLAGT